jgi:hypothetical protein
MAPESIAEDQSVEGASFAICLMARRESSASSRTSAASAAASVLRKTTCALVTFGSGSGNLAGFLPIVGRKTAGVLLREGTKLATVSFPQASCV